MDVINSVLVLDSSNPLNTTILNTIPLQSNRLSDLVFDSVNNKVYVVNTSNIGGVEVIDCSSNIVTDIFRYGEIYTTIEYCPTYNILYLINGNRNRIDIFSLNTFNLLERINNLSSNVTKSIYYPVNDKLYMISQKLGITILESLSGSITLNSNCTTCENIFSGEFQQVLSNPIEIFDCEKCVGYEDGVEVIIEPIQLYVGTGTTQTNCVEINNKTICSKVFIKSIDDNPTFNGTIKNMN
jgi:DNA-binding beta-propeller fold protein YncE